MPTGKQAKGQREQTGAGASSNLEQGGDVRVRPESRLREMETLVKTQWINNQNGRVAMSEPNQGYHPSCKQKLKKTTTCKHAPEQTLSVRRTAGSLTQSDWIYVSRRGGTTSTLPALISDTCPVNIHISLSHVSFHDS